MSRRAKRSSTRGPVGYGTESLNEQEMSVVSEAIQLLTTMLPKQDRDLLTEWDIPRTEITSVGFWLDFPAIHGERPYATGGIQIVRSDLKAGAAVLAATIFKQLQIDINNFRLRLRGEESQNQ